MIKSVKIIVLMALSFELLACASHEKPEHLESYRVSLDKAVTHLKNNKKVDLDYMRVQSEKLIELSDRVFDQFSTAYPECRAFLSAVTAAKKKMQSISLEQMEEDYHGGAALPKSKDFCFESKELLVHPATVYLLSKNSKLPAGQIKEQMTAELEELQEHFDEVKLQMKKKS